MLRTKKRRAALMAGVILALVWLLWPDRQLARVRALQAQLSDQSLTEDQRRETSRELRTAMGKLSPAQRDQLFAGQRGRMEERLRGYAKMTPKDKQKYLDDQINREEEMRKRMAQQGTQAKGAPPGGGLGRPGVSGPGGGPAGAARPATPAEERGGRHRAGDRSTPEVRGLMDQAPRSGTTSNSVVATVAAVREAADQPRPAAGTRHRPRLVTVPTPACEFDRLCNGTDGAQSTSASGGAQGHKNSRPGGIQPPAPASPDKKGVVSRVLAASS
ncbi:MAG: hypothetical protein U0746_18295 [Gemmataceae bacterium]